ncbi:MAG: BrnT family toxin [Desulfovermiculus sp.]|nr:BrnT family toxin [Desulfovermiculus sp.]
MIKLEQVTGFNWDEGNSRKSAEKHGVSQSEAEQIFFNEPLLLLSDPRHSQKEIRYHALGTTDNYRLLHITFTLRAQGTLIRIISARDMHWKEKRTYERSQKDYT